MPISNRQWKKIQRKVVRGMIDRKKNEYGKQDLTPYNIGRKEIVVK